MRIIASEERGVVLATVLCFMVITFTFITSMLTMTGNEIVISGLQRDGVRALELAQAGVQEAVRRIEEGRPYIQSFTGSLDPRVTVEVVRRTVGTNSAYQEIQATATVGRAVRRLSFLVLQRMIMGPPNITFASELTEEGTAQITRGDVYARTFVKYKSLPTDPNTITYAGWRISKAAPGAVGPCYTHAQCVSMGQAKWYPARRQTEYETTTLGADIKAQTTKCPAGGGGALPPDVLPLGSIAADGSDVSGQPLYGFDRDNVTWQGIPIAPQAVTAQLPCGLPYKYVPQTFTGEDGVTPYTRVFKTIMFEQWLDNYWQFDETQMTYLKKSSLNAYPEFGAVPPFPDFATVEGNYDRKLTGGGTIPGGDFGCKLPEMSGNAACTPGVTRPIIVWLDGGDWYIDSNLKGHGTIVVDGNLIVQGDFEYWGTLIVNGTLTIGAGSATIHGGLVTRYTLNISGNITVEGGGTIPNAPVGRSIVHGKAWWER